MEAQNQPNGDQGTTPLDWSERPAHGFSLVQVKSRVLLKEIWPESNRRPGNFVLMVYLELSSKWAPMKVRPSTPVSMSTSN